MNDTEYFNAILKHIGELQGNGERSALWPFWIPDRESPDKTAQRKQKLLDFFLAQGYQVSSFVHVREDVLGVMEEILVDWSGAVPNS